MDTILFLGPYTGFHPTRAFTIFRASEWDAKIIFGISKLFRQISTVSPGTEDLELEGRVCKGMPEEVWVGVVVRGMLANIRSLRVKIKEGWDGSEGQRCRVIAAIGWKTTRQSGDKRVRSTAQDDGARRSNSLKMISCQAIDVTTVTYLDGVLGDPANTDAKWVRDSAQ
ncbi:hypothetical protein BO79DRAFT_233296 [Aspergillus costaricaensis CBS 115574]|uniref:Uncharacterized protein n=1 Tax=Aspergillus costaricaensis CBS 115574 TaxID=1448317 RepID=A0ACD1HZ38_9EURO|nr:hypothetical protein BO79DRAFT_233296 [Aspergillus costaricaensis CBS 115574]RAK83467.1 hypothetical protein BO79DRAFT_233296 [Aspergillus costaricaensis CBS 115574]